MRRRTWWILGTWTALALFVVAVAEVFNGGGWTWLALLAVTYPASLYGAYRVAWMEP